MNKPITPSIAKRKVLIVEDNDINRALLESILEDSYDVITAKNGQEAYEILSLKFRELSLILLDVYMPICNGFEFMERIKDDAILSSVPIVVTTASNSTADEVKCLSLGASDFITKPYNAQVVRGKVSSIIKLHESVATLKNVEVDELTGFYTVPAFLHHARQMLAINNTIEFDMLAFDITNFKMINTLFGEDVGDSVLIEIGKAIKKEMPGVLITRNGDRFFLLAPDTMRCSGKEMNAIINRIASAPSMSNLNVNVGIYNNVAPSLSIMRMMDRALLAISSIKENFSTSVAVYDDKLQGELEEQQKMEAAFDNAILNSEFVVYLQPKVNVKTNKIEGAEALVRWIDSTGKMISPGKFIPLFEHDGLISRLDEYIFKKICKLQRVRIDEGKSTVPISVNLSRTSIYVSNTIERYSKIIESAGIPKNLVPIELTESATKEGQEIFGLVERLADAGFTMHLDDFGTGFSSMSSITTLPFDVIKLDKTLSDQLGNEKGNLVVEYMVKIAKGLGMSVVAEGIETKEQVELLKKYDCDLIQGYYYSKAVDIATFGEMMGSGYIHK